MARIILTIMKVYPPSRRRGCSKAFCKRKLCCKQGLAINQLYRGTVVIVQNEDVIFSQCRRVGSAVGMWVSSVANVCMRERVLERLAILLHKPK